MGVMSDTMTMRGTFVIAIADEGTKADAMTMADAFGRSFRAELDRDYDAILVRGVAEIGVFSAAGDASMQCPIEVKQSDARGKERTMEVAEHFTNSMLDHVDEYYDAMLLWQKSAGVAAYEAAGSPRSSIFIPAAAC
jgi:hypothetical protein